MDSQDSGNKKYESEEENKSDDFSLVGREDSLI